MAGVSFQLDKRFIKQAKGVFEKYTFDVGILQDGPHRNPAGKKKGLKVVAGGPARKVGLATSSTLSEVSESLRARTGINIYTKPFKSRKNQDILNLLKSFFDLCAGKGEVRRLENTLQAVVRNPILRGDYGRNSPNTAKAKGFNRLMIDTGQVFKAIQAKVTVKRVS